MKAPKAEPTIFEGFTAWVGSPGSVLLHTAFFIAAFLVASLGFAEWDMVLLVLTTLVSLEAIYLAIFIQMSVNRQSKELEEVSEDIDEIQEDVEEISEDVEGIQEDIDEIQEDVEEISEDVEEISGDDESSADGVASASTRADGMSAGLDQLLVEIKKIQEELEGLKSQLPKTEKPADEPAPKEKPIKLKARKGKAKVTPTEEGP